MLSFDDIMDMDPDTFTEFWNNNIVQDSALKLIGAREMTEEEKQIADK